jgi:hypothetical protein
MAWNLNTSDGPSVWSGSFWRQTAERLIKTVGGSAVTTFGGSAIPVFGIGLDPVTSLKLIAGTGIMSLAFSLGTIAVGQKGTPSAVSLEED